MIGAPQIEEATSADIEALARLRRQFGWSYSLDLLTAVHRWQGGRLFVIREGALGPTSTATAHHVAVATAAVAAPPVGVIGSVMVRPEFQQGGLGRAIMEHALTWLARAGVRRVYLDATPAGRPLYRRLGFEDVTSSWYTRTPRRALNDAALRDLAHRSAVARVREASAPSLSLIAALDRQAYGGDRLGLLDSLMRMDNHILLIAEGMDGAALGYAMIRPAEAPMAGVRVGPLVASDDSIAAALIAHIVERDQAKDDGLFSASIAGDNPHALALFRTIGATPVEDDLIMRLDMPGAVAGEAPPPASEAHGARVYCWLAPMVF